MQSFTAIQKETELFCGSFLRKGEVLVYVGSIQNLKDLLGACKTARTSRTDAENTALAGLLAAVVVLYRLTSLIRKRPPPWKSPKTLGIGLR